MPGQFADNQGATTRYLQGDLVWKWIRVVRRIGIPLERADRKALWSIGDQFAFVALRDGKIWVETWRDGHNFVAAILQGQRIGQGLFTGLNGRGKGKVVWIIGASGLAA